MADVYVNRKLLAPNDSYLTHKSTSLDQFESIPTTTNEEYVDFKRPEYLNLVCTSTNGIQNGLANSANNRDFYTLNQLLVPFIEKRTFELLDSVCALHWCCFSGHIDLVNKLLDIGCDPFLPDPINYESPIYYAIKSSSAHIVSVLLKRFGPLILCHENRIGKTPFLVAVSEFVEEDILAVLHVLEFLYLSGVSVEEQDQNGTTAVMFACKRGQLFVVQWLLKKGADLSHRDHFGSTVLHYAVIGANLEVVMFLVQKGLAGLTKVKSLNNVNPSEPALEQDSLDLCKERGNKLQYLLLWMCWLQWRTFGRVYAFNSVYPVLYWLVSVLNLLMLFPVWSGTYEFRPDKNKFFYVFLFSYFMTQAFWVMNKLSDPGVSKNEGYWLPYYSPPDDLRLTPFEGVLDSLHKRQQMVNFEYYCINKDLNKHFFAKTNTSKYAKKYKNSISNEDLLEPLNDEDTVNPFLPRVNTCNEEINNITTEMRSVYPQVANERCTKNTKEYNNAVLNFENSNKICLTCGKTRAMREHHCAICNTCLIRQDHHCAWLDNCVGSGNQKKFFVFLSFLGFTFVYFYFLFFQYFTLRFTRGIVMRDVMLFSVGVLGNGLFLFFVIHLWLRTIRSMLTDVTYYEFLKKPPHIRLKYKGNVHERLWDFKGLKFGELVKNVVKFWTYKVKHYEAESA
nr:hypothetical protein MACL_00001956 [Theileria orientalis]